MTEATDTTAIPDATADTPGAPSAPSRASGMDGASGMGGPVARGLPGAHALPDGPYASPAPGAPDGLAAFQGLVLRRLDEIREAQRALAGPAGARRTAGAEAAGPEVELITGTRAIAEGYVRLQRSARREILALATGPVVAVPAAANSGQREAMRAGVRYRVVYDRDALALSDSDTPPLLEHWASLGEEMRVAFGLPLKLVLVDRSAALVVPLAADAPEGATADTGEGPPGGAPEAARRADEAYGSAAGEEHVPEAGEEAAGPTATVLRSRPLLDALGWIFDRVWDSALPVPAAIAAAVDGPLTADDRRLLTLLLNGYTDQAIGSQLGVSERTVQRRVRRLLALAGARSRLQLGWHAARHHWL
ncbi:helix-turn-helix transcriptional regulator [Streptomyces wedmorensis]|uniref:helix-turn-helix transcriptional regulator n=1 Tax=Streptomyces wedmorensis TaxID=43759 RepID=UPI0037994FBB